jgi:hypothetical protein
MAKSLRDGENQALVLFGLEQVPEMTARASGCNATRMAASDIKTFKAADGLSADGSGRAGVYIRNERLPPRYPRGNRADAGACPEGISAVE